jgi:hypothetical protein
LGNFIIEANKRIENKKFLVNWEKKAKVNLKKSLFSFKKEKELSEINEKNADEEDINNYLGPKL